LLLFTLSSVQSAWAGPPTDQLREGVEQVVKTLKDPQLRGDSKTDERMAAIGRLADKIFDFTETAKRALRQHWAERTPAEREEFVRLFTGLIQRTYLSKVDQYNPEMTFQGDTVDGDEAIVRTGRGAAVGTGAAVGLDDAVSAALPDGVRRRVEPRGAPRVHARACLKPMRAAPVGAAMTPARPEARQTPGRGTTCASLLRSLSKSWANEDVRMIVLN
jgi:hypothetical protein